MDLTKFYGNGDMMLHLYASDLYVTTPKEEYTPPPFPVELPTFPELEGERPPFGKEWMKYFNLQKEGYTFVNHGAYGATLKQSLEYCQAFERYMDSHAGLTVQREIIPLVSHTKREVAEFIGCEAQDIFFTGSVTSGVNTVLKSLTFTPEDTILSLSLCYGSISFSVDAVCEKTGAKHQKLKVDLTVSGPDEIINTVANCLHDGIKMAVFDHIPSSAGFIMPLKKLAKLCHDRGILVMVDGAHSLGQLDLQVASYGVDFYITNCHKWFCNPKGSSIGYVKREHQHLIKPLITTWGHGGTFVAEFIWAGAQYYSPYIALRASIKFWNTVGTQAVRDYCSSTVKKAAKMCAEAWGVKLQCPEEMIGSMVVLRLPDKLNDPKWQPQDGTKRELILDCLHFEHQVEVAIRVSADGTLFVRMCCHIYNDMSDYERLCSAVLAVCEKRDSLKNYGKVFDVIRHMVDDSMNS